MNIISKAKLSKLVLLGVSVFLLFNFISCGKESPTGPEEPEQPTAIEGKVVGLIKGQPVKLSSVELCHDSGYVIDTCLVEGNTFRGDDIQNPQLVKRIRIRSDEAYDRETNLSLQQGMNNIVTLNMIEYDGVTGFSFEDYQTVAYEGGASPRWKTHVPKFYIYDQSLFRIINSQYQKIGSFTPSLSNLSKIDNVIMNDIPILTDGFVSNPKIERETNKDPVPTGDLTQVQGHVIIIFRDDMPSGYGATTGHRHSNFDIYNGIVCVNANYPNLPRGLFSEDICATMGYIDLLQKIYYSILSDTDHGYYHGDYPYPFDTQYIPKIKYGRLAGNMFWNGLDYDPISRGTSGLLLYRIEPIYELNPLNQFNQFQQPTFTLPKDKIHKKQRLNKDLK